MHEKSQMLALGRVSDLSTTPISNLTGLILSGFTQDGTFDIAYTTAHKQAYSALIEKATYQTVYARISKEGGEQCPASKLGELRRELLTAGFIGVEADLSALFATMSFPEHAKPTYAPEPDEAVVDIPADAAYEIMQNVRLVMKAYKELYSTVFDPLRPKGAFSMNPEHAEKHGAILHNTAAPGKQGNDSRVSPSSVAMNRVATLFTAMLGESALLDSKNVKPQELGARSGYYFPRQAGRFASGTITSNGMRYPSREVFEEALNKWVYGKLSTVFKFYKAQGDEACLTALEIAAHNLATAFIVAEFDSTVSNLLVFKVCAPSLQICTDRDALQQAFDSKKLIGVQVRGVHLSEGEQNDYPVYTVTVALNAELERNAPMYAYQVWDAIAEGGGDISKEIGTHNIVFGRKYDGSMQTFNMAKHNGNNYHNMTVVAASRSGKGLTTLATLAAAAAHHEPIFYLDCKPDMMSMLQKHMTAKGQPSRLFAYDALGEESGGTGNMRVPVAGSNAEKYKHYEFPHDFNEYGTDQELFGAYIFAKAMTLLLALMSFAPSNEKERWNALGYDASNGLLAVFDELEKVQLQHWDSFIKLVRSDKLLNEKEGSGKSAPKSARAEYVAKLAALVNELSRGMEAADKALLQRSPVATLSLFQTIGYVTGGKSAFKGVFGKSALVGNMDTGGASQEIIKGVSADSKKAFSARQWYVYPNAVKGLATSELTKPVKPFLVFNTPDDVEGYFKTDTTFNSLPHEFKQGVIANKNKMHFVGLLESYGVSLADSLSKGYDIMQRFLQLAGFEGTVDDFVLSAHKDTLISYTELNKRAIAGLNGTPQGIKKAEPVAGDLSDDFEDDYSPKTQANISAPVERDEVVDFVPAASISSPVNFAPSADLARDTLLSATEAIDAAIASGDGFTEAYTQPSFGQRPVEPVSPPPVIEPYQQQPIMPQRNIEYIDGMRFYRDAEDNVYPVDGRYAPPHDVEPGIYNGQKYSSQPVIESVQSPFSYDSKGNMQVTDPRMMAYAQEITEPTVRFNRALAPITYLMGEKQLEKAVSERWRRLLAAGARLVGNAGLVMQVLISENSFIVNGKSIPLTDDIIGDSGITVANLADFPVLFSTYKNLQQLDLDVMAQLSFNSAYSSPAIPFTRHKTLQFIRFQTAPSSTKTVDYTRGHAAQKLDMPQSQLTSRFTAWTLFASQVNKGKTSSFCTPGHRLRFADFTVKMAAGAFGKNTTWSKPRRAFGVFAMLLGGAGTVVTGGVQVARALSAQK